jgi:hypothetical protein
MESYLEQAVPGEFAAARRELEKLIAELGEFSQQIREHGEVEQRIGKRGHEIMRLLMQDYLDRVAQAENKLAHVEGTDGWQRRHARVRKRTLMTRFGEVVVTRLGYSAHGKDSVYPLDAHLNLPLGKYSHGLREWAGETAATASFDATVEHIGRHTGGFVPKRQTEELARKLATDFDAFYAQRSIQPSSSDGLLIMSVDGKGIVMRHEDLREGTRRAAEEERHKLAGRLSKGEKRHRKRMATVATVYEVGRHHRLAEAIMGLRQRQQGAMPKPCRKRVWASVRADMEKVLDDVVSEAKRRDPERRLTWVMLVDGHEEQLRQIDRAIKRHGVKVKVVQDFIHVLQYLWEAAWCLHPEGSVDAERWVQDCALALLCGRVSQTAAGMRRSATRRWLLPAWRAAIDRCADYLLKNRARLDYATALREGWPIATGVVEGACRHLVKDRMECGSARWSLDGAEAVLRLRALRCSQDWDAYLAFHREQERLRNYPSLPFDNRLAA